MPPVNISGKEMITARPQGKHWTTYKEPIATNTGSGPNGFPNVESFQKLGIIERLTKGETLYHQVDTRDIFLDRKTKKSKRSRLLSQKEGDPDGDLPMLRFPSLDNAEIFSVEPKPVDRLTERKEDSKNDKEVDAGRKNEDKMELLLPHFGKIAKRSFLKITPFPYETVDIDLDTSSSEDEEGAEDEKKPRKKKKNKKKEKDVDGEDEPERDIETPTPNTPPAERQYRVKLPPIPRGRPPRRSEKEICQVFRYSLAMDELLKEEVSKKKINQIRQRANEYTDRRGNDIKVLGSSVLTGMRVNDFESVKGRFKRRKVSVAILEPITDVDTVDGTDDDKGDPTPAVSGDLKSITKKDKKLACRKEISRKAIRFKIPKLIQPLKHQRKSAKASRHLIKSNR